MGSVNIFKAICLDQANNKLYYARNGAIFSKILGTEPFAQALICGAAGITGYSESVGNKNTVRFSSSITSLCMDKKGALIVVDSGNHCIRKVNLDSSGVFLSSQILAGVPGQPGYDGAAPIATSSRLRFPTCARVDSNNTIYFSDTDNYLIRRIGVTNRLELVAGKVVNGVPSKIVGNSLGDANSTTPEANAKDYALQKPVGIAIDSVDTLYFADEEADKIFKVPSEGILKAVCGAFNNPSAINIANINSAEPFDSFKYFINGPYGLVFDAKMDLYVTSKVNNQILKLTNLSYPTPSLSITCGIANSTVGTYRLYEQSAKYAELKEPSDIEYRVSTNTIYFCDEGNARIRSVIPEEKDVYSNGDTGVLSYGMLTAVANDSQISQTDGGDIAFSQNINTELIQRDDLGNIYYLESGILYILTSQDGKIFPIIQNLNNASYFCIFDSIYLYFIVGTGGNKKIQTYDFKTKVLRDLSTTLGDYRTLCIHPGGTLFIGMPGKIMAVNVKDNSPQIRDFYLEPNTSFTSMCIDDENNLYALRNNNAILRFLVIYQPDGTPSMLTPTASVVYNGGVLITSLGFNPKDTRNIYYSNVTNGNVGVYAIDKMVNSNTPIGLLVAGTGKSGNYINEVPATNTNLKDPRCILFNLKGELFILDRISTNSVTILKSRFRQFLQPNCIYNVIGFGKNDPSQSSSTLSDIKAIISDTNALSATFDEDKNIFLAELDKIRKIDMNTGIVTRLQFIGSGINFIRITDIKVGAGGELYIVDNGAKKVYRAVRTDLPNHYTLSLYAGNGSNLIIMGNAANSGMEPTTITLDSAGNVYIFCSGQHQILKVDFSGLLTVFTGTGVAGFSGDGGTATVAQLHNPIGGVSIRSISTKIEDLIFSDSNGHRIRKISGSTGIITTIAGTGVAGFSGDGGTATAATFNSPRFVTVDSAGNIYIADQNNNRIRRIDTFGIITTVVGNGAPEFTGGQFGLAGFSGDGGLATDAQISNPYAISIDSSNRLIILQESPKRLRIVPLKISTATVCGLTARSISIEPAYLGKRIGFEELLFYTENNVLVTITTDDLVSVTSVEMTNPISPNPERSVLNPGNTNKFRSHNTDSYPKWVIKFKSDMNLTSIRFKSSLEDFVGSIVKVYDNNDKIITTRVIDKNVLDNISGQRIYFVPPWSAADCNLPITALSPQCGVRNVRYVRIAGTSSTRIQRAQLRLAVSQLVVLNKNGENVAIGKQTFRSPSSGQDGWPTDGYMGQSSAVSISNPLETNELNAAGTFIEVDFGEKNVQEILGVLLYNSLIPEERVRFDKITVLLLDSLRVELSRKVLSYSSDSWQTELRNRIQYEFFDFRLAVSEYGCPSVSDILTTYKSQTAEVFNLCAVINGNLQHTFTKNTAIAFAAKFGYRLATYYELLEAYSYGADWCFPGWVSDRNDSIYPINDSIEQGCGNGSAGIKLHTQSLATINCYGIRPNQSTLTDGVTTANVADFNAKHSRKSMSVPLRQKYVRYLRVRPKFRPYVDPEVFNIFDIGARTDIYNYNSASDANSAAVGIGLRLATLNELIDANHAGAQWCNAGWLSNNIYSTYPITSINNEHCGGIVNGMAGGASGIKVYGSEGNTTVYGIKKKLTENNYEWIAANKNFTALYFDNESKVIFSQHQINLSQIVVISAETGENLAVGKVITASVSGNNSTLPRKLISGDYYKRDQLEGYISDINDNDPWVEIDLGREYLIDSVQLYLPKFVQTGNYSVEGYTEKRSLAQIDSDPLPNPMSIYPLNEFIASDIGSFRQYNFTTMTYTNNFLDTTLGTTFKNNWFLTIAGNGGVRPGLICGLQIPNLLMKFGYTYTIKCLMSISGVTTGIARVFASMGSAATPETSGIYDSAVITSTLRLVTLKIKCAEINGTIDLPFTSTGTMPAAGNTVRIANLEITEEAPQNPITKIYGSPVLGTPRVRFVRIEASGMPDGYLNFKEVQVIDVDNMNVALNKPVTASQIYMDGKKENAADGIIADALIYHSGNLTPDVYWQVDLGAEYEIKAVVLYNRTDGWLYRIKNASLALIDKNNVHIRRKQFKGDIEVETLDFRALDGVKGVRYVKVTGASNYLAISQLAVFDKYGNNVSLFKNATAQSYWQNLATHAPSLAVNGTMSLSQQPYFSNGNTSSEWFTVDLGAEYEVVGVTYINRNIADQLTWIAGASVQLLSSASAILKSKTLKGGLYREDLDFTDPNTPAISPMISTRILTDPYMVGCIRARYVRIENPGLPLIGSGAFGTIGDYSKYRLYINEFKLYDTKGREITAGKTTRFKTYGDDFLTEGTTESTAPLKPGNTTTYMSSPIPGSWWEVDLGKEYNICSLLYKHRDWTANPAPADASFIQKSMQNIPIKFYSQNREEKEVIFVKNNSPTFSGFCRDLVSPPASIPSGSQGLGARFVRIQVNRNNPTYQLKIQQIIVIDSRGINVALGRRTYSSENYPVIGNTDVNNYYYTKNNTNISGTICQPIANQERHILCNGRFDNFYLSIINNRNCTNDNTLTSISFAWVEIDLGDLYDLTAIHYYGASISDNYNIQIILYDTNHVKVPLATASLISGFRTSLQTIDLGISSASTPITYYKLDLRTTSTSAAPTELIPNKQLGKKARYVRIETPSPSSLILSQLVVIDCLGRNVALNKRVSGNSSAPNHDNQNCVNGIYEPFISKITHTSRNTIDTYLEIDLEEEYYIVDVYTILRKEFFSDANFLSTLENSKITLLDSLRNRNEVYTFITTNATKYTVTNPGTYSDKAPPTGECNTQISENLNSTQCLAKCGASGTETGVENFPRLIGTSCYGSCEPNKEFYPNKTDSNSVQCADTCTGLYQLRDHIDNSVCLFNCEDTRVKDPGGNSYEFKCPGYTPQSCYCMTKRPFSQYDTGKIYIEYAGYTQDSSSSCFPGSATVVILTDKNTIKVSKIQDLQIGNKILSINNSGEPEFSELYMWGHRDRNIIQEYYKIKTKSGHTIQLTKDHYIYSGIVPQTTTPDTLHLDGIVYVYFDGKLQKTQIQSIKIVKNIGSYNPYTLNGRLLVDSIFVSAHSSCDVLVPVEGILSKFLPTSLANRAAPICHQNIFLFVRILYYIYGKKVFTDITSKYDWNMWKDISLSEIFYSLALITFANIQSCVTQTRLKISVNLRV